MSAVSIAATVTVPTTCRRAAESASLRTDSSAARSVRISANPQVLLSIGRKDEAGEREESSRRRRQMRRLRAFQQRPACLERSRLQAIQPS
eukprot:3098897-Rhodomonas_salina.1